MKTEFATWSMEPKSLLLKIAWMQEKFNGQTQVTIYLNFNIAHCTWNISDSKLKCFLYWYYSFHFQPIQLNNFDWNYHLQNDIDCKTDKLFSSADRKSDYWLSYEYSILVVIIFSILIELLMYKLTLIAWNINDTNSNCKKERVCYIQNFCMKVLTSKFHKLVIKRK